MIKVIINGINGRMGKITQAAITSTKDCELVAGTTKTDNLGDIIQKTKANIVIDFTIPSAAFRNAQTIIQHNVHPIIGTTGLTPEQIEILQSECAKKNLGGIITPNFSIAAMLMMKYAQDAAHYFDSVEIIEKHHEKKLDAPSGTAVKTAAMIKSARNNASSRDIPIHSVRLPNLYSEQTVLFSGDGEFLSITHDARDRRCYIPGILLACRKVMSLTELIYGLEHIL